MKDIVYDLPRNEPVTTRPLSAIDGIAIHHSDDMGDPWIWARYHTTPPDQGGPSWGPAATIGYHVAVMRDGTVYKCARDMDKTPGVANHNWHLIHIVCQGNFSESSPPPADQVVHLLATIQAYRAAYAIPIERVKGHTEWVDDPAWATTCPGFPGFGQMIRSMLKCGFGEVKCCG